MKKIQSISYGLMLFAGLALGSCSVNTSNNDANQDQTGAEYTSAYICPMHCDGSGSDAPGKCPVCGMDYEKNETHSEDGHEH